MPNKRQEVPYDKFIHAVVDSNGNFFNAAIKLNISRQFIFILKKRYEAEGRDVSNDILNATRPKDIYKPITLSISQETLKIIAIGDHHDSPYMTDKSRIIWIARHIAETKPDMVVQIGDVADFDSVSTHAAPGTVEHSLRPTISTDMESLEECLGLYNKILPDGPNKILTAGNHEDRLKRFENNHPEVHGGVYRQFEEIASRYGWKTSFYGQWVFVNGVGFIHTPFNQMGREYGGKNPENTIANDAIFSIVCGHTHKGLFKSVPKIGPAQTIEICNLGSSMPNKYVKKYAGRSTTGWTYGVWELSIRRGHVVGYNFVDMETLEEKYGD